ncbi:MAG: serine/threonine protein kinase [Okeania sp. SIO2C9]|uniref:AAA-like domain-containing protein n=1 Tax=Okeania sp. SIO2C9 TaxID=2607791 RepID=UPI0013C09CF6|nr:AAA-like domain-containing protein [Okeania sp. SIO2C9]NEQ77610.1 serine/threonine protein kinase [Okeania sp. SIO2C9]
MTAIESISLFTEQLVRAKTGKSLSDIEREVLRLSLSGKTYSQIAYKSDYSRDYISQNVAPKLWKLLSNILKERISKTNCLSVLERQLLIDQASKKQPIQTSLINTSTIQSSEISEINDCKLLDGRIPMGSPYYIERAEQLICYSEINKPGSFLRIKAPRQMGKTSLLMRTISYAIKQQYQTVRLSLRRVDSTVIKDINKFLRWFCASVTRKLQLESKLNEYWDEDIGSIESCTLYFQEYLLSIIDNPIVLAIDEVDYIFQSPEIANDFLSMLHSWYGETKEVKLWQKLRIVLVKSTEVYIAMNINKSPFNMGIAIDLSPFTLEQIQELAHRYQIELLPQEQNQLMRLVGGHPYLINTTFYHIKCHHVSLESLIKTAATDTGIYSNHLHQHLQNLQQYPELKTAFEQVLRAITPVELEQVLAFKLKSMGLVVQLEGNLVMPSCDLYRRYFYDVFVGI